LNEEPLVGSSSFKAGCNVKVGGGKINIIIILLLYYIICLFGTLIKKDKKK
jgi:hypothetical protein